MGETPFNHSFRYEFIVRYRLRSTKILILLNISGENIIFRAVTDAGDDFYVVTQLTTRHKVKAGQVRTRSATLGFKKIN